MKRLLKLIFSVLHEIFIVDWADTLLWILVFFIFGFVAGMVITGGGIFSPEFWSVL